MHSPFSKILPSQNRRPWRVRLFMTLFGSWIIWMLGVLERLMNSKNQVNLVDVLCSTKCNTSQPSSPVMLAHKTEAARV